MNINPTRYTLTVNPKEGKPHNPIHDAIQGTICSILDIEIGERGWFMVWSDFDGWHRIHTSTVESVMTDEASGEAVEIVVTTHNTVYTFKKIEETT